MKWSAMLRILWKKIDLLKKLVQDDPDIAETCQEDVIEFIDQTDEWFDFVRNRQIERMCAL